MPKDLPGSKHQPLQHYVLHALQQYDLLDAVPEHEVQRLGLEGLAQDAVPLHSFSSGTSYLAASLVAQLVRVQPDLKAQFGKDVKLDDLVFTNLGRLYIDPALARERLAYLVQHGVIEVDNLQVPISQVDVVLQDLSAAAFGRKIVYETRVVPLADGAPESASRGKKEQQDKGEQQRYSEAEKKPAEAPAPYRAPRTEQALPPPLLPASTPASHQQRPSSITYYTKDRQRATAGSLAELDVKNGVYLRWVHIEKYLDIANPNLSLGTAVKFPGSPAGSYFFVTLDALRRIYRTGFSRRKRTSLPDAALQYGLTVEEFAAQVPSETVEERHARVKRRNTAISQNRVYYNADKNEVVADEFSASGLDLDRGVYLTRQQMRTLGIELPIDREAREQLGFVAKIYFHGRRWHLLTRQSMALAYHYMMHRIEEPRDVSARIAEFGLEELVEAAAREWDARQQENLQLLKDRFGQRRGTIVYFDAKKERYRVPKDDALQAFNLDEGVYLNASTIHSLFGIHIQPWRKKLGIQQEKMQSGTTYFVTRAILETVYGHQLSKGRTKTIQNMEAIVERLGLTIKPVTNKVTTHTKRILDQDMARWELQERPSTYFFMADGKVEFGKRSGQGYKLHNNKQPHNDGDAIIPFSDVYRVLLASLSNAPSEEKVLEDLAMLDIMPATRMAGNIPALYVRAEDVGKLCHLYQGAVLHHATSHRDFQRRLRHLDVPGSNELPMDDANMVWYGQQQARQEGMSWDIILHHPAILRRQTRNGIEALGTTIHAALGTKKAASMVELGALVLALGQPSLVGVVKELGIRWKDTPSHPAAVVPVRKLYLLTGFLHHEPVSKRENNGRNANGMTTYDLPSLSEVGLTLDDVVRVLQQDGSVKDGKDGSAERGLADDGAGQERLPPAYVRLVQATYQRVHLSPAELALLQKEVQLQQNGITIQAWTKEQVEQLQASYATTPLEELSAALGKTESELLAMGGHLRLRRLEPGKAYTPRDLVELTGISYERLHRDIVSGRLPSEREGLKEAMAILQEQRQKQSEEGIEKRSGSDEKDTMAKESAGNAAGEPSEPVLHELDGSDEDDEAVFSRITSRLLVSGQDALDYVAWRRTNTHRQSPASTMPLNPHEKHARSAINAYIQDLRRYPMLTEEEEAELGRRVQGGDEAAVQHLITSNLRLVVSIAKHVPLKGFLKFDDLVEAGNVGLVKAALKFDPQRGYRFVTYAHWWIRQAISREIDERERTVRLPSHVEDSLFHLSKAEREVRQMQHRPATIEELSTATGLSTRKILLYRRAKKNAQQQASLDAPMYDDEDTTLADVLADPHASADGASAESSMQGAIMAALDRAGLSPREQFVLKQRFYDGRTLDEVGEVLNISRERVRQIESIALGKTRKVLLQSSPPDLEAMLEHAGIAGPGTAGLGKTVSEAHGSDDVRKALDGLTRLQREVVIQHHNLDGNGSLSFHNIGRQIGGDYNTVYRQYTSALNRLERQLGMDKEAVKKLLQTLEQKGSEDILNRDVCSAVNNTSPYPKSRQRGTSR